MIYCLARCGFALLVVITLLSTTYASEQDDIRNPYVFGSLYAQQPLMKANEGPLLAALFHFPPLAHDPNIESSNGRGLMFDLYVQSFEQIGLNVKTLYYPPNRYFKQIADQQVDMFAMDIRFVKAYAEFSNCNKQALYYQAIVLYQNATAVPHLLVDIKTELKHQNILVPQQSKAFFSSLVNPSNHLQATSLPRNMARMFAVGRADYMIDYHGRADSVLSTNQARFKMISYPIAMAKPVICIHKRIAKNQEILQAMFDNIRANENSAYLKQLERQYHYVLNWHE